MKIIKVLLFGTYMILSANLFAQNKPYQYVSPKPGSVQVSPATNIILRPGSFIDQTSLSRDHFIVEGSRSGVHNGELILSDDGKTIVFNPDIAFSGNEVVNVIVDSGIRTSTGSSIPEFSFHYTTAPEEIDQVAHSIYGETSAGKQLLPSKTSRVKDIVLPAPPITIDSINSPSQGYIFMATWDRNVPALYGNFVFVLDSMGQIVDSVRVNGAPFNFEVQPNGLLSYALGDFSINIPQPGEELQHIVMDKNLVVVDSFKMKNGYPTDFHEFKMLPNGHVMMMSYYTVTYDMSTIVEGGQTDASLVINIIQEQDKDKNVVFEWRNIDYIPITDSDLDLTGSRINYGTLNAFDLDDDGNILASFRNHSEITKISRETGEIIWRMGGRQNQFTYVGEHEENAPYYHARQHNIQRRPNGNITLFDNGEFHDPPYSRAVEYSLDEENKVATLVSDWRYQNGNIFCVTAGNAEPLPNGGWFIGYGVPHAQFVKRNAVEVHGDGSVALELSLPPGVLAYRTYKLPWKELANEASFTHYEVVQGINYSYNNATTSTGVEITYNTFDGYGYNESTITRVPYGPLNPEFTDNMITVSPVSIIYDGFAIYSHTAEFRIDLSIYPEIKDPENTTIYYRETPGEGLFEAKAITYDEVENELIFQLNGLGEIAFGVAVNEPTNHAPILLEPENKLDFIMDDTVTFSWTGKGLYNSFNFQISNDSTFATVLLDSNTNVSNFLVEGLKQNSTYFWRINSLLGSLTSEWSEVWRFSLVDTVLLAVDSEVNAPGRNYLQQNYPNPFSTSTKISYTLQNSSNVNLIIYSLDGKEIQTLINEFQPAGKYIINFEGGKYPGGTYYYKLRGNEFAEVRKMIMIR